MTTYKNQKPLKILVIIVGVLTGMAGIAFAQEKVTVIGEKDEMQTLFTYDANITGYGSWDNKFTQLAGQDALIIGAHGGVIFNSYFSFGLGAYGSATTVDIAGTNPETSLDLSMGYTGLMMGFNVMPRKVVHFSIPLFVGVGNLELEHNNAFVENSAFLLFEPGLQLEVNVVQFMKIGLGGGYRMVHGINLRNPVTDEDLTYWTGNFSLIFGKFR
jgi:hypothetical protein